ncbi:MAG: 6-hydroxymethylpterin diphosphokinase MptE-like protein [Candidatus Paceibacterota bacterium]|jgi:hypothetical protein
MNLVKLRDYWLKVRSYLPLSIRDRVLYIGNLFFASRIVKKNRELKNIHLSKRCFIIGNGPSIKNQDLTLLKNEITFVTNKFYLHKDFDKINPKYYTTIDPLSFEEDAGRIQLLKETQEKASNCMFFFPYWTASTIQKYNLFQKQKVYYLAIGGEMKENKCFHSDIDKPIPSLINVVLPNLFVAHYMGFKEIYLLGCDHDWLAQPSDAYPTHFYDKEPLYKKSFSLSYEKTIPYVLDLFRSYRLIKEKFSDVKIYNATAGGFLDVFPRVDYEEIVKNKK